jgi:ectoine hydroxylase-related dioxygenase (phytanoyl-CoA dioxygenase family)
VTRWHPCDPTNAVPDRAVATPDRAAFAPEEMDAFAATFAEQGFAALRGVLDEAELAKAEAELAEAQRRLVAGELDQRFGTAILEDPEATREGDPFAHYVCFATDASPAAGRLVRHPLLAEAAHRLLGAQAWLLDYEQFGVVFQDARPEPGSGYSRIGWHTDHQSGPHLDVWPGAAFTVHFDPTSPANGFLRVLPRSHLAGTDGIPLGFERVPGEVALYLERGDVLFHHSDLWHAAARATAEGDVAIRRHLRGSWHGGAKLEEGHGTADFVKNALR